jgi:hypothetical protein
MIRPATLHGGFAVTVEGISTPQPPEKSNYQAARVAITLVCLVVVPILALVGWGDRDNAAPAHRHAHAKSAAIVAGTAPMNAKVDGAPFSEIAVSRPAEQPPDARLHVPSRDRLVRPAAFSKDESHAREAGSAGTNVVETGQDRMQALFERLQHLGATYYKLETAAAGNRYWFQCKLADAAAPFEAGDRLPLLAIERVVGEVEAFRGQSTAQARTSLHPQTIRR